MKSKVSGYLIRKEWWIRINEEEKLRNKIVEIFFLVFGIIVDDGKN